MLKLNIQLFAEDGKVVIGTVINTDGINEGINDIKKEVHQVENKSIDLGVKVDFKDIDQEIERLTKEYNELYEKTSKIKDIEPYYLNGVKISGQTYDATEQEIQQLDLLANKINELNAQKYEQLSFERKIVEEQKKQSKTIPQPNRELSEAQELYNILQRDLVIYNEINNKKIFSDYDIQKSKELKKEIDDILKKIEQITGKKFQIRGITDEQKSLNNVKGQLANIGNEMKKNISKVKTLVLGIFGIRGAYMAVRNAINIISNDDQQMKADIDYIRNVLAYSLEPVVRTIVGWAKTLVSYIGYLAKAWFNYDIFAKATAKSLQGSVGSAKELRKQLAGFDEMNVLQDNQSGGGGAGGALPDFEGFQLDNPPKWLEWIANNGDGARVILEGIASAILAIKYGLGLIKGLGLFFIIDGVFNLIKDIQKLIKDPSWDNWYNVLVDIGEILSGFGLFGHPVLAIIGQLLIIIPGIVNWIKAVIELLKNPTWENYLITIKKGLDASGLVGVMIERLLTKLGILPGKIDDVNNSEQNLMQTRLDALRVENQEIYAVEEEERTLKELQNAQETTGISIEDLLKTMEEQNLSYKDLNEQQRLVYKAYKDHETAQENLNEMEKKLNETTKIATNNTKSYGGELANAFDKGSKGSKLAKDTINPNLEDIQTKTEDVFAKKIPNNIEGAFKKNKYEGTLWDLVGSINNILGSINPINLGMNIGSGIRSLFGFAKGGIVVPRLASGGIINQPGRGVPIGQAIGGEKGMEGVIPLTDSQQMELLGSAIGRYITINANIVNTMNGRVISRELKRVQTEDDFASNN